MHEWSHPSTGVVPIYRRWTLQVVTPLYWVFRLNSSPLAPESLPLPWSLGPSSGYPSSPLPSATCFCSISWSSVLLSCFFQYQILPCLFPAPTPSQVLLSLYVLWLFCSLFFWLLHLFRNSVIIITKTATVKKAYIGILFLRWLSSLLT